MFAAIGLIAAITVAASSQLDEFDTSSHSIPLEDILSGGPPKDGIPALHEPQFIPASAASFLRPDDRVIGIAHDDEAKAYPIRILNWHEVVNDVLGSEPIVVTYCPLTASEVVYERSVDGEALSFGVSGRLYRSNVLMYDQQTNGLWSQLKEEAVTGERTGTRLPAIPSETTTWADWRARHSQTLVLSPDTGHRRNYARDPYRGYHTSPKVMFPLERIDGRLPLKERVLDLRVGDQVKAYPLRSLAQVDRVHDQLGGKRIRIEYAAEPDRASAIDRDSNESLPGIVVYWFAWAAFHPDTAIWQESSSKSQVPSSKVKVQRPKSERKVKRSGELGSEH